MIAVNFTDVVGLRNFEKNAQQKTMHAEFTHITQPILFEVPITKYSSSIIFFRFHHTNNNRGQSVSFSRLDDDKEYKIIQTFSQKKNNSRY